MSRELISRGLSVGHALMPNVQDPSSAIILTLGGRHFSAAASRTVMGDESNL